MTSMLAAAPVLVILATMLGLRWSAAQAGAAGLATAIAVAVGPFGGGDASQAARLLVGVAAEGTFLAATILWILWPALALHEHQQRCGALGALSAGLAGLTPDRTLQVLIVGWFVALFLEGAAGFGTPVALAAPLLVGLGVPPVRAVVVALLGHAAGVSFGALGTPVLAQQALAGVDATEIAWRTAALHAALGGIAIAFVAHALRAGAPAVDDGHGAHGSRGPREAAGPGAPPLGWTAFAAVSFLVPSVVIAATVGPELPTLGGALVGGTAFCTVLRWRRRRRGAAAAPGRTLARALWPYAVLVAAVAATRAVPGVAETLGAASFRWSLLDRFGGGIEPLLHPGTLLLVALVVGARLQHVALPQVGASLAASARRLVPVGAALVAMLCVSRLMLHAGMIDALQTAVIDRVGDRWPWFAPALGALGSFVTGSATASNVLFTSLQASTAEALGLPVALLAAAQGVGAAIGNVVCPHNVVAGAATVGLAGREAAVLRRTAVPCAIYLAAGGALVAAVATR